MSHVFYYCRITWKILDEILVIVKGYTKEKDLQVIISLENVLFNQIHPKVTHLANFVLLVFKSLIYTCRCTKTTPTISLFKTKVEDCRRWKYYNAKEKGNSKYFYKKWYGINTADKVHTISEVNNLGIVMEYILDSMLDY